MAIHTRYLVSGVDFSDALSARVRSSISDNSSSSDFEMVFPNDFGLHNNDFILGNEVSIRAQRNQPSPGSIIFTGIIEDIRHQSNEQKQTITLTGRDYSARLMDVTIPPTSYNNREVGSIVRHILANFVNDAIGSVNVGSFTGSIQHIRFNHVPVFEAFGQLAEEVNAIYYVDENRDLNFRTRGTISSSTTLSSGNVTSATRRSSDQEIFNRVFVFGDRFLTGFREIFTPDGAGSVLTLQYRPHNTQVIVNGSVRTGGIFEMNANVESGLHYLVDFDNRRIVFVSGTSVGYNEIPQTGSTLQVNYNRDVPVAKLALDQPSISQYGLKEKIITDKNIKSPVTARELALNTLKDAKDPKDQIDLRIQGIGQLIAGQTITVNLPDLDINTQVYDILEVTYDFNKPNNLSEEVISLRVSKKLPDITDTIKTIMLAIKKLQAADTEAIDVVTRLEVATGSFGFRVPEFWRLKTNTIEDSYIVGHPINGRVGDLSDNLTGSPRYLIGDRRTRWITQQSGGQV